MLWYICLGLSMALIFAAIHCFINKKYGLMRYVYVLLCCFGTAYVIYIPPFFANYNPVAAIFGAFINMLQVVSLDADYLAFYETIKVALGDGFSAEVYEAVLAIVHFSLPAVSAMTAVTMILQCLTQIRMRLVRNTKRNLYVFSEVNYNSETLATDIRKFDPRGEILFLEQNNDLDHSGLQDALGCTVLDEQIENIRAKAKNRKVQYYCISANEEANLNAALALLAQLQTEEQRCQRNNYIFLFSKDPLVEPMVDSLDKGLVEVDVINQYQMAAYRLLEQHPLVDASVDGKISVLLYGFGSVNRELLRAISWCGQLAGNELFVRVVADLTPDEISDFKSEYPGLFTERYNIQLLDCKNRQQLKELLRSHCADARYIAVEGKTEAQTVETAVFLRRFYYCEDPAFENHPAIYAYIENAEKAEAVRNLQTAEAKPERRVNYDIVPFGAVSETFSFANVTNSSLEKLAKNVHLVYEDIFSDTEIDADEAIKRYNLFEVNKRSNRANALHIRYKLSMLGLDYTDDPNAQEVELSDYLTSELLDRLTLAEHDRWMAFLESEGWSPATVAQVKTYQASGISRGRHNCPLLKLHPYICPFEDLKDCSDALGLPDSTVYDRDLITRIPDILHDKWGINNKKYKIIKKKEIRR